MINFGNVFTFVIVLFELFIVGAIIFLAIDKVAKDEWFKKIAKVAVGGALFILFLFACRAVFTSGESGMNLGPLGFLIFAISVILTVIVWVVIDRALVWIAANWFTPLAAVLDTVQFVLAGLVLVVILGIAAYVLFGYSIFTGGGAPFLGRQHGELTGTIQLALR